MTDARYNLGYNRGKASVNGQLDRYRKAVDEATERARRAEAGVCGPCQDCARWRRNDACRWGYCDFPKVIGIEDSNWWGQPGDKVCTQENFGCVRFLSSVGDATFDDELAEAIKSVVPYKPKQTSGA